MNETKVIREYEEINEASTNFNADDIKELKTFALKNTHDERGKYHPVLELRNGKLKTKTMSVLFKLAGGRC